jgi:hypothetical protein
LWGEALALLRQLFLPPDARHRELARLAALQGPAQADALTLESLLAAPGHLEYFLARIDDPDWLDLLDASGLLEPADGQSAWPVYAAVQRLRAQHAHEPKIIPPSARARPALPTPNTGPGRPRSARHLPR